MWIRFLVSFGVTGSSQRGPTQFLPSGDPEESHGVFESFLSFVRSCQYCGRKFHASDELTKLWRRPKECPISCAMTAY